MKTVVKLFVENPADLAKFTKGLAANFSKAAASHDALAAQHEECMKAEQDMASYAKGKQEGMQDEDTMKAYLTKVQAYHVSKAASHEKLVGLHKGLAETNRENSESVLEEKDKAAPAEGVTKVDPPVPAAETEAEKAAKAELAKKAADTAAVEAAEAAKKAASSTVDDAVAKALAEIDKNPELLKRFNDAIIDRATKALGDQLESTNVRGVIAAPEKGTPGTPVVRKGAPTGDEKVEVAPEFADLVSTASE